MQPTLFQSTPVITDGRTPCGVVVMMGLPSFNPRPSSLTGELELGKYLRQFGAFQSTPVITDGRTPGAQGFGFAIRWFQSTPVITDGRTRCAGPGPGG